MQINKTDQNDAEGLAQIVRTGWYRSVHVKSFESHRARALLGARTQLIGMTTRLSNHIRGVLKTFGLLPGAMRGLPFDRKVEALLLDRSDVALIVRPMLVAWRQLREQIAVFDKAIRVLVKSNSACRLLMSVPGIGVLSALAYVSTVEDPARFVRSRSVGAHLGLTPRQYQSGEVDRSGRISRCGDTLARTLLYEAAVVILTRVKRASSLKDWARVTSLTPKSVAICLFSAPADRHSRVRVHCMSPTWLHRQEPRGGTHFWPRWPADNPLRAIDRFKRNDQGSRGLLSRLRQ